MRTVWWNEFEGMVWATNQKYIRDKNFTKMSVTYKKVKTIADIIADPRVKDFIRNYDGRGVHMVELKNGFNFERERTIDIGTVYEICDAINDYAVANEENGYQQ